MIEFCTFTEPQEGASYDDLMAFAQATEEHGLDGFFRSEHFVAMGDGDGLPGPTDAWITLAGLARETSRIKLGTLVTSSTYRHPGLLAIQVAQVDQMSSGRAELGLGTGWFEREHKAYGIPFPVRRFGLLEEALAVVTGLWSTPVGETFSFTGQHFTLEDAPALPKPLQSPLPVIVGGHGTKRTPALAAAYATEYNLNFGGNQLARQQFATVRAACSAYGRDPESLRYSIAVPTAIADDETTLATRLRSASSRSVEESGAVVGSKSQAIERIRSVIDLGVDRIYFQLMDPRDLDHVAVLGEIAAAVRQ